MHNMWYKYDRVTSLAEKNMRDREYTEEVKK